MARDNIHIAVRKALEKDNWTITNDPFYLESGGVQVEIDLAAEKFIIADKGMSKIIVEIKSLSRRSLLYDFHAALGQYIDYRGILKDEGIERQLYLAIPETTFSQMQAKPFYGRRLSENNISIIIVDILNETIVQWIK
jgi:XisH protein